jgi:hypothetical protein
MTTTKGTWPPPKAPGAPDAPKAPRAAKAPSAAEAPRAAEASGVPDVGKPPLEPEASTPERDAPPSVLAKLLETAAAEDPIFESVTDLFERGNLEGAVQRKVESMHGRISELWPKLPEDIQGIIRRIADEEGVATEQIAAEWMVQRMLFLEIGRHFKLKRVDRFSHARPDCLLALTERGSLITGGPPDPQGARAIEYIRIPSRVSSWTQGASLKGAVDNVRRGHRARLPGLRTSPIQYILVIPANRAGEFSRIANVTRTGIRSTFVGTS